MIRTGLVLASLCIGAYAIHCHIGGPNYAYSAPCAYTWTEKIDGTLPSIEIKCCKKTIIGPMEVWGCADRYDVCENREYEMDSDLGFDKEYVEICTSDDCNSASLPALASLTLALTTLLAFARQ